ncbi:MAG: BLUF domain-containing protein [Casimicrobiaceae bacterium]
MSETLVRLIYASRAVEHAPNHVRSIMLSAQRNNPRLGITGMLVVGSNHFVQALEGDTAAVNALYCKIVQDKRHVCPRLLSYGLTHVRFWAEWSMAYAPIQSLAEQAEAFGLPRTGFDPLALDSEIVERLLLTVSPTRTLVE